MHVLNIHAAYMSSVNNRYHHISLQSLQLYLTLIECTKRSQVCDPTLQHTSGSKLCLGTDKFNKCLKKPYLNTSPPRGNSHLTGTTLAWSFVVELDEEATFGVSGFI